MSLTLLVPTEAAGERLDRYLARLEEVGSRAEAERALAAGRVRVDGQVLPKSHRLGGGERVEVEAPEEPAADETTPEWLRIPYEDEHLLVVDKPAGIAVHPGAGRATGTLVQALAPYGVTGGRDAARPGIVHRLDRDTSGLLVVARSDEAYRRLADLVRRREIEREYLALVRGQPQSWAGRIEAPIGRDRDDPTRQSLDTDAPRDAVTHFRVLELLTAHAFLSVRLETGRMHQIRVHLASIGLPVVGDRTYGVRGLGLRRQFLHAARLAFDHPFSGDQVVVESPLPADLEAALGRARTG